MLKKILILTTIVFALGAVVVYFEKPFHSRFEEKDAAPLFPNIQPENVWSVEVQYFIRGFELSRTENGEWMISEIQTDLAKQVEEKEGKKTPPLASFPADPEKGVGLIEKILNLNKGHLVTSNKDRQNELQVGPNAPKIILKNKGKEALATLVVGKQGPTLISAFVRDLSSDDVYLVDEYLSPILTTPLEEWKKLDIPPTE